MERTLHAAPLIPFTFTVYPVIVHLFATYGDLLRTCGLFNCDEKFDSVLGRVWKALSTVT